MGQNTIIIEQVPVTFDLEVIARKLRIRAENAKAISRLAALAEEAENVARPKAVAKLCGLNFLDDERLQMEEAVFISPLLRQNMGALGRAFPYLATEGKELAEWALSLSSLTDKIFADGLRESAVKQAEALVENRIRDQFDMAQVSAMNPGSLPVWPIAQQVPLFQLLAPSPDVLGVTLLPSYMMKPEHSVSGIFFQTDTKYYNCSLCPQKDCPNRKAPSTVM